MTPERTGALCSLGRVEARTFRSEVLAGRDSVKGFKLVASDGAAGRISWASYAPGEAYLVVTTGLLRRRHCVVPAGAVVRVEDHEVHVKLTRSEIAAMPVLTRPADPVADAAFAQMTRAFDTAKSVPQRD
jgi:hypothetical protein